MHATNISSAIQQRQFERLDTKKISSENRANIVNCKDSDSQAVCVAVALVVCLAVIPLFLATGAPIFLLTIPFLGAICLLGDSSPNYGWSSWSPTFWSTPSVVSPVRRSYSTIQTPIITQTPRPSFGSRVSSVFNRGSTTLQPPRTHLGGGHVDNGFSSMRNMPNVAVGGGHFGRRQ